MYDIQILFTEKDVPKKIIKYLKVSKNKVIGVK